MNQQQRIFHQKFTENKAHIVRQRDDSLLIASFNVHGWVNLSQNVSCKKNYEDIVRLVSEMKPDVLVLQEVCLHSSTQITLDKMRQEFGMPHVIVAKNGGCFLDSQSTDYLVLLSKKEISDYKVVDITLYGRYIREAIHAEINGITIAACHLEIGKRFHHLKNAEMAMKIIQENTTLRISQLKKMLTCVAKISVCIGDFNFTPEDKEFQWLLESGFSYYSTNTSPSNPFNRTDMIFIDRKHITALWDAVISTNYSDHLPIISELHTF